MPDRVLLPIYRHLPALFLSATIVAAPGATTVSLAHNVETDGDVGATFHLEPDHNPKSGEPATVWFALTREGGDAIPFDDCDCSLEVTNTQDETETIDIPELTAIDVETYTDIPSTEIVFPQVGIYNVVLTGQPSDTATEAFAFELSYEVTVRPGNAQETASEEAETAIDDDESDSDTATSTDGDSEMAEPTTVVDSWLWLIGSVVLLGSGSLLAVIAISRSFLKQLPKRRKHPKPAPPQPQSVELSPDSSPAETPPLVTSVAITETSSEPDRNAAQHVAPDASTVGDRPTCDTPHSSTSNGHVSEPVVLASAPRKTDFDRSASEESDSKGDRAAPVTATTTHAATATSEENHSDSDRAATATATKTHTTPSAGEASKAAVNSSSLQFSSGGFYLKSRPTEQATSQHSTAITAVEADTAPEVRPDPTPSHGQESAIAAAATPAPEIKPAVAPEPQKSEVVDEIAAIKNWD